MNIKKISLKNFRNYDEIELSFNKKINIIIGNNAQGKTNILESIYTLAITKSFFNILDKNLIKYNQPFLKIKGTIELLDTTKELEIIINENGKKVKINNNEIDKLSEYISKLNVIIFTPDNIRLLKEGPHFRRKNLNIELSQLNNNYLKLLNSFNILLKQRNEYLKIINNYHNYDQTYLEVLNNKYADLAIEIYLCRYQFINDINNYLTKIYKKISGFDNLKIKYVSHLNYNDDKNVIKRQFIEKLNKNFEKEKMYKMTIIGPHRDDFYFYLDEKNISLYGSQGQLRMSVLALKFSEIEIFYKRLNEKPILLLDDIFSELDTTKKNRIMKFLDNDIQTIITTTDIDMIDKKIIKQANIYKIKEGKIVSVKTRRDDKNE